MPSITKLLRLATLPETRSLIGRATTSGSIRDVAYRARTDRVGLARDSSIRHTCGGGRASPSRTPRPTSWRGSGWCSFPDPTDGSPGRPDGWWVAVARVDNSLDVTSSTTRKLITRCLRQFAEHGVRIVRLDAVGYAAEGRAVNRHDYTSDEIQVALDRSVVRRVIDLVRLRNTHPAFEGDLLVEAIDGHAVRLRWQHAECSPDPRRRLRRWPGLRDRRGPRRVPLALGDLTGNQRRLRAPRRRIPSSSRSPSASARPSTRSRDCRGATRMPRGDYALPTAAPWSRDGSPRGRRLTPDAWRRT